MTASSPSTESLATLVRRGMTVALGDGVGAPSSVYGELSDASRSCGGVTLVLGWSPTQMLGLDFSAFERVVTLMGGYSMRRPVEAGEVEQLPVRLGTTPSLLHRSLRPDLLVMSARRCSAGDFVFTSEVSWQRAAVLAGARVAIVERENAPRADSGPPIQPDRVSIVGASVASTAQQAWAVPNDMDRTIADRVGKLVSPGCRIQFAPGPLGAAVLDARSVPVIVDSGILTDDVVRLDQRGLLLANPLGTYLAGSDLLYDWADCRRILDGVEWTHDPGRLASDPPLVAVNTASANRCRWSSERRRGRRVRNRWHRWPTRLRRGCFDVVARVEHHRRSDAARREDDVGGSSRLSGEYAVTRCRTRRHRAWRS